MEIDELAVKITGDSTSLQAAMRQASDAVGSLGIGTAKLNGLLGAAGLAGAFKLAYNAANVMVQAYRDDEVALLKYNAALAASTLITAKGKKELDEYVPVFASIAGLAEADTQAIIAMLSATGRNDAEIKMMMETALGMSNVLGGDVNSALTQLTQTLTGLMPRTGALKLALDGLTAEQLKSGEGIRVLNQKYGEFSGTLKNSADVSIKNFQNAWSDLMSTMGQSVEGTIQPVRNAMTGLFREIIKQTQDSNSALEIFATGFNNFVNIFKQAALSVIGKGNIFAAIDEAINHTEQKTRQLMVLYAGLEDPLQKRIRLEKEAAEKARQEAAATASAAEAAAKAATKAQIEGRKEAQKAYEDSLAQIDTMVKLGVITEQEAADAKYLANRKLIDDLIALGYTGAKETKQIGDQALADAVARNNALYENTSEVVGKIIRGYSTAIDVVTAYARGKVENFKEARAEEQAELDAIEASKRATETAASVRAGLTKRFVQGKREEQKEIRDAEQAELDAIAQAIRSNEAAAAVRAVLSAKHASDKREQLRQDKLASQAELDAIEAAKKADETATTVRQQLAETNRKAKLEAIKEVRDADIAASAAIAEADLMAAKVKSTTDLLQKQARLEKLQGYRDARIAEQAELDLIQKANAEYRNLGTQRLVLSQKYTLAKQEERVAVREAEKAEYEAIQKAIRDAKTTAEVRDVLARAHSANKRLEIKETQDAAKAEYEAIQESVRANRAAATVRTVLTMEYAANKRLELRAIDEVGRVEYETIQASVRAAETAEIQKAILAKARSREKIEGFREDRLAEQEELDKLADYIELKKRDLIPQAGLGSVITQEKQDQITLSQITASESEKRIELIKQQLLIDLELHRNNAVIKKALMDKAAKDIYAVQVTEFTVYARTIMSLSSQLFSGIGSLVSAQATAAIDAIEKRLENLKKSYGDTASELQTMYDALERMGAKEKAASVKAQLDKEKAVQDYTSLSMEQLASLYTTAMSLNNTQAAAEITAAMARVQAEKDAAEEIKQIKYQAAVAEWNMKLMSTTASAAQAVMDTFKSLASNPVTLAIAPFAAAATAAFGAVQVAAVAEAKPKLDTGGVIRARDDTAVTVGRGTGEVMFGTGALGDPLMQGFADLVAARVSRTPGASRLLPVQIVLDGRVVAESTVKLIDDGQVRFRKPLKVAQR